VHARRSDDPVARREEIAASRAVHPAGSTRDTAVLRTARPDVRRELALARRVAVREQTLARRRRTTMVLAGVLAVVTLALPLRALGAVSVSGQTTPLGAPSGLADGSSYTVHAGDTLTSIAAKVNPADTHAVVRALVSELGTTLVVPGEHIRIP
jgi:cell envelope opacity-associated protein A